MKIKSTLKSISFGALLVLVFSFGFLGVSIAVPGLADSLPVAYAFPEDSDCCDSGFDWYSGPVFELNYNLDGGGGGGGYTLPDPYCVLTLTQGPLQSTSYPPQTQYILAWTAPYATSFSINNGIGNVTPATGGTYSFTTANTPGVYTGTAVTPYGTVTCSTIPLPPAPICTLDLTKDKITWTTTNATSVVIVPLTNSPQVPGGSCTLNNNAGTSVQVTETALYNSSAVSNDLATFGVTTYTSPTRKAGFASDQGTLNRLCSIMHPGSTGNYQASGKRGYDSPSNDQIVRFINGAWVRVSATTYNSHVSGYIVCDVPAAPQCQLSGVHYFVPPLGVGTHTYELTAAGPGGTIMCEDTIVIEEPKECELEITKTANKTTAEAGEYIEYTINFKNTGDAKCTGSGVKVADVLDQGLTYISETHSSNIDAGYITEPVYTSADRTVRWNAWDLDPGETGWAKLKVKANTPSQCSTVVPNRAKITSLEYNNFGTWVQSSIVNVTVTKDCTPPPPGECKLEITKSADKTTVGKYEYVEFTLNFKNIGTKNCTGGGVKVWDTLDPMFTYISETHSSNVAAGYLSDPVYKSSDRTVRFNADTLTPGESGWAKIKVKTNTPSQCAVDVINKAKISAYEYNNFQDYETSNIVTVEVTKDCTPPPPPGACKLEIAKSANKENVGPYEEVEYTISFKNVGGADCTGDGVKVIDVVDSRLEYKSETHSSNVAAGYTTDPVYTSSTRTLTWNAGTLTPNETGWVKWKAKTKTPAQCTETVPNKAKITSKEYSNFTEWVESNTVNITLAKECTPTYGPYCGDGVVNQTWEQCDGGLSCNDKCQLGHQCRELVLARINVTDVRNSLSKGGDMTSDLFIGGNQTANKIPENTWFALFYNGVYFDDADINAYENVPGLAVERESGKVRARMYGSYSNANLDTDYNEHVEGYIELWQGDITSQVNDATDNNAVEGPFDSQKQLKAGKDELWLSYGKSYFWLSVNHADDSFYTLYDNEAPSCNVPEPECTLDANPTTITQGSSSTLTWTTTNATAITIDNGVGSVTPVSGGTKSVSPSSTTWYKATVTGPGGEAYCKAKVYVTPTPHAPVCSMSLSPTTINPGGTSTLSWTSSNVTSVVINNGVGSVVTNGSTSVSTTTSATYTGTFTGPGGTVTCNASLTVNTPTPQCTLSLNKSSINPGESVVLSWTSSNMSSGSANGNVGTLSPVSGGSMEIFPSDDFTYIATFTGPHGNAECRATVDVVTVTTGCRPGTCPGGFDAPTTVLFQKPGEQPLAFVYLSQIPYTGFEAGPALTLIFWLTVAMIAALGSYYVMGRGGLSFVVATVSGYAGIPTEDEIAEAEQRERERAQVYGAPYPVVEEVETPVVASVATLPAVSVIPMSAPAPVQKAPAPSVNGIPELTDVIESRAHAAGVLISPEAVEMAAELSPDRAEALRIFGEIINEAVRTIPREDGWVMLTSDRFETFASTRRVAGEPAKKVVETGSMKTYVLGAAAPAAPTYTKAASVDEAAALAFAGAVLSGDRDTAFSIIRSLEHDNVSPTALMTSTASVLDRLYRARRGGTNGIDAELLTRAANVSDESLHRIVEVITHALDPLYSNPFTGVKLALAQAFEIVG